MTKKEFKEEFFKLLDRPIGGMSFDEQINYVEKLLVDFQKENEEKRDTSNKGKEWTDEQLKIILSDAASASNCMKYAKIFHRGYGSIEQIYRWSTTPQKDVDKKRGDDKFVLQVKRIAKELGLRG